MVGGEEAVKEARVFIDKVKKCQYCGRKPADLVITDVPKDTLRLFRDFANSDEFAVGNRVTGHFGFALKFLLDYYLGRIQDGYGELSCGIESLKGQVSELYSLIGNEKEEVKIELLSGKKLKVKK